MASLLSFLRAGPPPPRVALLPDSAFFTRTIPVPEGATPAEVAAAVELGLEAASPFPLAQLYHGWYWRPSSPHAFAFAAYRRRFSADEVATWADAELVLPAFAILRSMELTQSLTGLTIVYAALNIPFLAWILMGFFEGIPVDLEWAAMTDGTTAWGAFWRIVLPVSLPGLAAAGVLGFILSWNEFLFALVLTGSKTATIPVALASLQTSNGIQIGKVSAGVVLAILPLIIASRFIQRFIVQGLTFGSVK